VKVMIYKKERQMTMELLEACTTSDVDIDQKAKYSAYISKFLKPDSTIPESIMSALGANPVFLARNVRKWKTKNLLEWISDNAKRTLGTIRVVKQEPMEIDSPPEEIPQTKPMLSTEVQIKTEPGLEEPKNDEDVIFSGDKIVNSVQPTEDSAQKVDNQEPETHLVMKSVEKSHKERTVEFLMQENLQCQFNLSSYRMVYLTNSEDCIYLKGAMQRARKTHKKLSMKLSKTFHEWHQKWLTEHVPEALSSICTDFLLDKNNVVSPRKTSRSSVSRADKPPYRKFHMYATDKD